MGNLLWIKQGRILDPHTNRDQVGDLFVKEDSIVASLTDQEKAEATILEATGKWVLPGLIDLQVHFREPGQSHKETIASGSRAAAAGGFTTVVNMGNTNPSIDSPNTVRFIRDKIETDAVIEIISAACSTKDRNGSVLAPIGSLAKAGIRVLADNEKCIQNASVMQRVAEYSEMFDLLLLVHCQDYTLTGGEKGSPMREGECSLRLGMRGWPRSAEETIVARNCIIARDTGVRMHFQHITSANSLEFIQQARSQGVAISVEVSPHHLTLLDREVRSFDSNYKMNPPLCGREDQEALWKAIKNGWIDAIASGHAPHQDYEKEVEFDKAPYGIVGLETLLPLCCQAWQERGLPLLDLVSLLTIKPAKVLQIERGTLEVGALANVIIFDPEEKWIFNQKNTQSLSCNSPWLGKEMTGKVQTTVFRGKVVFLQDNF